MQHAILLFHIISTYPLHYYTTYLKSWASSANCKQACDIWFCDVSSILLLAGQSSLCQQLLQTKSAENKLDLNCSSANVQQQDRDASLQVEESLQRDTRSEAKGMLPRPEFRSGEWYQIGVKSSWFLLTPWVEATHLFRRIVARTLREPRNAIWASRNVKIYTVTYCNDDTHVKIVSWHARWIYLLLSNCTDIKFKFARVCSSLAFWTDSTCFSYLFFPSFCGTEVRLMKDCSLLPFQVQRYLWRMRRKIMFLWRVLEAKTWNCHSQRTATGKVCCIKVKDCRITAQLVCLNIWWYVTSLCLTWIVSFSSFCKLCIHCIPFSAKHSRNAISVECLSFTTLMSLSH